jgi:hypothetical protein
MKIEIEIEDTEVCDTVSSINKTILALSANEGEEKSISILREIYSQLIKLERKTNGTSICD